MMKILFCIFILLWGQSLSFPLDLIPADEECADVQCPQLDCINTIKKEGECCDSCITVDLIPEESKCDDVTCPQLNCTNTMQKEGDCCMSCNTIDGCLHGGEHYEELAMVPMNRSDPCEACFCFNGNITCNNISESCPRLKCTESQQVKEPKKCCPRCINENPISPMENISSGCKENGISYQENDTWNPYYVQFGIVKCLICTCKNATITCAVSPCPPVRACTPNDPIEEETYCCPKCNRTLETNGSIPYIAPTLDPNAPPDSNTTCSEVYSHRVYETVDKKVDQLAIENTTSSRVQVHVWSPGIPTAYTETYKSKKFANKFINMRFKFIGNTTAELVKTFHEWLEIDDTEQSIAYCKTDCSNQVIGLLQPCN